VSLKHNNAKELYMKIGYIRISSVDQNADRQVQAMLDYGINNDSLFIDTQSGKDFNRPKYQLMLKTLRAGDILCVKSIDRFGRNYADIQREFKGITDKGIFINVLDTPILNTDRQLVEGLTMQFIADIILTILGYVAEQERVNIKQRQVEGIRSAKAKNVAFGRPTINKQRVLDAQALVDNQHTVAEACKLAGISKRTYYNYLKLDRVVLINDAVSKAN
jgi:DNA invertase Pin-like site-specific DNA recombinase